MLDADTDPSELFDTANMMLIPLQYRENCPQNPVEKYGFIDYQLDAPVMSPTRIATHGHGYNYDLGFEMPKVKINAEGYATAGESRWRYPANGELAPRGANLLLLTIGRKQVEGIWSDTGGFIAWAPCIQRDKELEERLGLL